MTRFQAGSGHFRGRPNRFPGMLQKTKLLNKFIRYVLEDTEIIYVRHSGNNAIIQD